MNDGQTCRWICGEATLPPRACPSTYAYGVPPAGGFAYDGLCHRRTAFRQYLAGTPTKTSYQNARVTGLDYVGTRYFSGAQGRLTSPDPLSGTLLHVLNPQRWNMYAYAVNNPLVYTDPDGRDAIAVRFSKLAVHAGHAGVASVHRDGRGTYADYGPVGGGKPFAPGHYNFIDYKTQIQYGPDGKPTAGSLTALTNELADAEGQPHDSVTVYYYKASDSETAALDAYIDQARKKESEGKTPYYVVGISDCIGFCVAGLRQANVDSFAPFLSIPNLYAFGLNQRIEGEATGVNPPKPKEKVTSKICYTDENGKKVCQ